MITTMIVGGSLLMASIYTLAWLLGPGLRRQIESPKLWFGARARQYDRACQESASAGKPSFDDQD